MLLWRQKSEHYSTVDKTSVMSSMGRSPACKILKNCIEVHRSRILGRRSTCRQRFLGGSGEQNESKSSRGGNAKCKIDERESNIRRPLDGQVLGYKTSENAVFCRSREKLKTTKKMITIERFLCTGIPAHEFGPPNLSLNEMKARLNASLRKAAVVWTTLV